MNSFNHYAYGAIGEWLYRVVAGIEIDEACPGYKHAIIAPLTGGGLSYAQASYVSVYGPVAVRWEDDNGRIHLKAQVPVNATASVILEEGAHDVNSTLTFEKNANGRWEARIGSGLWQVSYTRA